MSAQPANLRRVILAACLGWMFSAVDIVVPFASNYHPVAVAWGIIAMYAVLAVEITSLLRRKSCT